MRRTFRAAATGLIALPGFGLLGRGICAGLNQTDILVMPLIGWKTAGIPAPVAWTNGVSG